MQQNILYLEADIGEQNEGMKISAMDREWVENGPAKQQEGEPRERSEIHRKSKL